jgi:replicative DNA helicase
MTASTRTLPNDTECEAAVIGGVFMRRECFDLVDLVDEDFYDPRHRLVWAAITQLAAESKPIDELTVEATLADWGKSEAVGGLAFIANFALRVPTPENVAAYAAVVRDTRISRDVMTLCAEATAAMYDRQLNGNEAMSQLLSEFGRLDRRGRADDAQPIGVILKQRLKELEDSGTGGMVGIPTGLAKLDRPAEPVHAPACGSWRGQRHDCEMVPGPSTLGGLQIGAINMLLGRPAMGKSALARSIVNACTTAGEGAHVFSMEDGRRATADNAMALASGVAAHRIRTCEMNRGEITKMNDAITSLGKRRNWIVDHRRGLTPAEIVRAVRRHRKENGTRLVVVDYLNLVRFPSRKGGSRADEMREGLEEFAVAAGNDDIAWLVLAQLNRDLEKRDDKRPTMADAKDCGAVEEMCKVMMAVYREHVYKPDHDASDMEVLLLKHSNGAPYTARVHWDGPTMTVSDSRRQSDRAEPSPTVIDVKPSKPRAPSSPKRQPFNPPRMTAAPPVDDAPHYADAREVDPTGGFPE